MANDPKQTYAVSDTIAQAAARGKFLDFRNNLVLAKQEDYAMLHGIGGSKHAVKSTIKLVLTDYGAGQGKSTTVSTNVTPELIPFLMEVCKAAITACSDGAPQQTGPSPLYRMVKELLSSTDLGDGFLAIPKATMQSLSSMEGFDATASAAFANLRKASKALPPDANTGAEFVGVPKDGLNGLLTAVAPKTEATAPAVGGPKFAHKQERVNVYKEENGLVPVSTLLITREGVRKNGEVSRLPWMVKIQNFWAKPLHNQDRGTTAYDGKTVTRSTEAFISMSDFDMYRCLYRVCRFVEVWEYTFGCGLIGDGLAAKAAERQAANQGQGSAAPSSYNDAPPADYEDDYYPTDY